MKAAEEQLQTLDESKNNALKYFSFYSLFKFREAGEISIRALKCLATNFALFSTLDRDQKPEPGQRFIETTRKRKRKPEKQNQGERKDRECGVLR